MVCIWLQVGLLIFFVYINGWNQSSIGQQIFVGLGLQEGFYGGNYWDKDVVLFSCIWVCLVELGGVYGQDLVLVQQIVDGSWCMDYDWLKCIFYVGCIICDDVLGLSDFSKCVDVLKGVFDVYNQKVQNFFVLFGIILLWFWLLWVDVVWQNICYLMDKVVDMVCFQEIFVVDVIVGYVCEVGVVQKELGSYVGQC